MGLVKCADCGKDVSDSAPLCPNCGRPMPGKAVQTRRLGAKYELNGTLLVVGGILLGLLGASLGAQPCNPVSMAGVVMLIVGFVVFLMGRFK